MLNCPYVSPRALGSILSPGATEHAARRWPAFAALLQILCGTLNSLASYPPSLCPSPQLWPSARTPPSKSFLYASARSISRLGVLSPAFLNSCVTISRRLTKKVSSIDTTSQTSERVGAEVQQRRRECFPGQMNARLQLCAIYLLLRMIGATDQRA